MEHILPCKPNPNFCTTCWDSNWLSIVLSDEKLLPWYIEHFISIYMESNNLIKYYDIYDTDYSSRYSEILEIRPLESFLKDVDDVVAFTKNCIDNGYYVNFTIDLFYIEFAKNYMNSHLFHGPLVYGYNNEKRVFYGYDLYFGMSEYKYDQYVAGCESLFSHIKDNVDNLKKENANYIAEKEFFNLFDLGLHTKGHITCVKKQNFRDKPLLGSIYLAIEECLEGKVLISQKNKDLSKWYGLSIYNKLNTDVLNNWEQTIPRYLAKGIDEMEQLEDIIFLYRGLRSLIENKEGLKYRINYLYQNKILPTDYDLLNQYDILCNGLNNAFSLFVKFNRTQNVKYLNTVRTIMGNMQNIDREVLEKSSDAIFNVIKFDLSK